MGIDNEVREGARNAVNVCMNIDASDRVHVLTDEITWLVGLALAEEAQKTGAQVEISKIEDFAERPVVEAPEELVLKINEFQPTVTFFAADTLDGELTFRMDLGRKTRFEKPVRHGHMPGITPQLMREGMRADYHQVYELTNRIYEVVKDAEVVQVTSVKGSEFTATFTPELRWVPCNGMYHHPGEWGNLPEGELFTCPAGLDGLIVADVLGDYFSSKYGVLNDPVRFVVEGGIAREVSCRDTELATEILEYLQMSENGSRVGEFAIGTNTAVSELTGRILQDEKIPGVHIAFGFPYPEITGADWSSKTHVDVIPTHCTIEVDGELLMKDGKFI